MSLVSKQRQREAKSYVRSRIYFYYQFLGQQQFLGLGLTAKAAALSEENRAAVGTAASTAIMWLYGNQTAEKEEYNDKKTELDATYNPIITKLHQQQGNILPSRKVVTVAAPTLKPQSTATVEEVD